MSVPQPSPSAWSATPRWPHLAVIFAVLLTYGFELFNFNVSVDEPMFWNFSRLEMLDVWSGQGRWGMGLTALVLPSSNVPVVSLALGLTATALAFWWIGRRVLSLGEWEAALTTSLAISMPALVFHFSFSINSLGLGLGFLACAASAHLASRPAIWTLVGAIALGAFAIGIYEGFAFVLASVFLGHVWRTPTWRAVAVAATTLVGSAVTWLVLSVVAKRASSADTGYVSEMMAGGDDRGLAGIVGDATYRMIGIVAERWLYFGYSNPLPALVLAVAFIGALAEARKRPRLEQIISMLTLLGLVVVVLLPALLTGVVFQRSMIFLPTVFIVTLGAGMPALRGLAPRIRLAGATVAVLAIAGHASLANGAYYSGTIVYDEDLAVATNVAATYRSLPTSFEGPLPAVIATRSDDYARPETWSGRSSLELGLMGAPGEALRFMQMRGLDIADPTKEEAERGTAILETMPAYPQDGYMRIEDGLLLINLSTIDGR